MPPIGLLPDLDRESIVPMYRQIYEHLREAILAGTLPESTRLPPERSMAENSGSTGARWLHAYRELVRDGLIEQRVGSGSRVVPQLRGGQPERAAGVPWWVTLPPWRVGEFPTCSASSAAKQEEGRISFVQGVAPDEPSPLGELANRSLRGARSALRVVVRRFGRLRAATNRDRGAYERARRDGIGPGDTIVLTGSTQGIAIVAQSLAEPGDEIIVESPSYPGALQVFQINGLRAIPVPVDDEGMRVDHVEAILRTRRPRFIYTMPTLHNPTSATMNTDRRERLVTIARRAAFRSSRTIPTARSRAGNRPPLVALAPENVVYLSTFSKRSLRACASAGSSRRARSHERLLLRKQAYDMATSLYVQAAIADYLDARLRRARRATCATNSCCVAV